MSALDNAFVVFRTGTDQELQRINEELIRLRSDTDTAQRLVESRMIDLKEAQASDAEQLASDFTAFKVDKTEEINAAREAFEEGLRLRAAFDLWRSKAMWHGVRFWIGLTLFVGGVIAAISSIVRYGKEFLAILPMKNEEPTYLAILIVVICAGGYGWVLRFFARYASDNLALGADAAQRRTMVHTYLALAADKDIKVEPSDRSMMLAAAFRPLPGQSTDDINVPTIVEVVQKAVGGGKAG
ncbi:hypothetical protein B5U98_22835 [Bosea sp. Tri-39]|nr:hypothetical protein BLM15_07670 [Bosea sp. Tri-49]RXT18113.1 hypothetical protein B5U98_22835 [Bosea sp. Tri-39]RXT32711.1 hypothetical protein B5U99_29180 [Bosea sp. Tri-54]